MIKFKELREKLEELKKNMNGPMNPGMLKPNATTGTSGGQGSMYRSEDGMSKNSVNSSPGGAQDMNMIKADKNGQWHMNKMDEPHKDDPHHEAKEMKIANTIEAKAKKLKSMHKTEQIANEIVEQLEKRLKGVHEAGSQGPGQSVAGGAARYHALGNTEHKTSRGAKIMADAAVSGHKKVLSDIKSMPKPNLTKDDVHYASEDGKNREANPKLRASDLGPGGKVHMIKEEDAEKCDGTNSEAASSKPHNKGKFKVMPMEPEKSVKHLDATGLPYSGKDKDVKKGEECSECHHDPCTCAKKSQIGHIQGNDAKGNDENKAPGRGTLTV